MADNGFSPGRQVSPPGGDLRLPTPPGVARRFLARHPWLTDSLVASAYLVPMALTLLVEVTAAGRRPASLIAVQATVVAVVTAALLFRRHAPLLVLAVTWAAVLVSFPDYGQGDILPVLIALYAVAVYRDVRSAWIGLAVSVGTGCLGALFNRGSLHDSWPAGAAQYAIIMLVATLIGVNVGNRKRYVVALLDRAAQLARERDQHAQLARVSERARIAREMHDIVAHSLSVIVALADGSDAIARTDPQRAQAAMREVAATGRSGVAEMRRLLGVLGEDSEQDAAEPGATGAPLNPQPGTGQLAELVESFRSAGLPTRLEMSGRGPSNSGVQLTIYRIVQESLTNVLRYSERPTRVAVRLTSSPGQVEVYVSDNGRQRSSAPSQGSGRGIIGLRERVALYGGTLDAGGLPERGWRVRATMAFDQENQK